MFLIFHFKTPSRPMISMKFNAPLTWSSLQKWTELEIKQIFGNDYWKNISLSMCKSTYRPRTLMLSTILLCAWVWVQKRQLTPYHYVVDTIPLCRRHFTFAYCGKYRTSTEVGWFTINDRTIFTFTVSTVEGTFLHDTHIHTWIKAIDRIAFLNVLYI